jgi:hypothetical protein
MMAARLPSYALKRASDQTLGASSMSLSDKSLGKPKKAHLKLVQNDSQPPAWGVFDALQACTALHPEWSRLIILSADGKVRFTESPWYSPTDEEIQDELHGWTSVIPGFNSFLGRPCIAYQNSEAEIYELPVNPRATAMWWVSLLKAGKKFPRKLKNGRFESSEELVGDIAIVCRVPDETCC